MRDWFDRDRAQDDEQVIVDYMKRLADTVPHKVSHVPDAGVLWVKSQLLRRWDAERKAQAPLDVMDPVQIVVGLAAAAVLLAWNIPSLLQALFTSI